MTHNHIAHYLWPLTLAVLLVNVALGYWRSRALVSSGRITAEERASFTRSAVLLSSVYCLVQWSVQAASHTPDPLCLLAFPPHGRFAVASWLVAVSTLALVLRWLWRGDGADLLARLGPAYLRVPLIGSSQQGRCALSSRRSYSYLLEGTLFSSSPPQVRALRAWLRALLPNKRLKLTAPGLGRNCVCGPDKLCGSLTYRGADRCRRRSLSASR